MASTSTSEAALRLEIARLTGAINRAKSTTTTFPSSAGFTPSLGFKPTQFSTARRSNTYVNPNYKPPVPATRPQVMQSVPVPVSRIVPATAETRDVVIGGVTFESSGRSLVRKDLPRPAPSLVKNLPPRSTFRQPNYARGGKAGHLIPNGRAYKSKPSSRGRPHRHTNRNMTLNNQNRRNKRVSDKPCPRFTTTGACSRGLTCMYQHDPSKIAICWSFLQGNCPNNPDTCNLSHDPTPERTPLCMHFANNGRCNRENCPFPHVRVSARQGVCRDFAVLGYCDKGLDCNKQHVRECPDFAEKGSCSTKGCKLPHVIRANRNRKPTTTPTDMVSDNNTPKIESVVSTGADSLQYPSAEDAKLGDEYISLTFHESESSDGDDESDESDEENNNEEDAEEGDDPNDI